MKYYVKVTETLSKIIEVEAETEYEALEKVDEAYSNSDIVLTADDFEESDMFITNDSNKAEPLEKFVDEEIEKIEE